jgi:hypothetical protein
MRRNKIELTDGEVVVTQDWMEWVLTVDYLKDPCA